MYKAARKVAGISTEESAWQLHIGTRTLFNYENGHRPVPPEVVIKMAEVYGQPSLTAKYCAQECPIGQTYAYPVETKSLPALVLGLVKEQNDVRQIRDRLIELAADGEISENELPEFQGILDELMDLEQKIEALKLWAARIVPIAAMIRKKKEKAAV